MKRVVIFQATEKATAANFGYGFRPLQVWRVATDNRPHRVFLRGTIRIEELKPSSPAPNPILLTTLTPDDRPSYKELLPVKTLVGGALLEGTYLAVNTEGSVLLVSPFGYDDNVFIIDTSWET